MTSGRECSPSSGAGEHGIWPDGGPDVESWRVVISAQEERAAVADATVRVRLGADRLVFGGEAADVTGSLEAALGAALQQVTAPGCCAQEVQRSLRRQCGLPAREQADSQVEVHARASDRDALLARLAIVASTYELTRFSYEVDEAHQHLVVRLTTHSTGERLDRLVGRLRRVISVTSADVVAAYRGDHRRGDDVAAAR